MYAFLPEELTRAAIQEHEMVARRAAKRSTRRSSGCPVRSAVARKLVQTGLRLDGSAGDGALRPVAKGRC